MIRLYSEATEHMQLFGRIVLARLWSRVEGVPDQDTINITDAPARILLAYAPTLTGTWQTTAIPKRTSAIRERRHIPSSRAAAETANWAAELAGEGITMDAMFRSAAGVARGESLANLGDSAGTVVIESPVAAQEETILAEAFSRGITARFVGCMSGSSGTHTCSLCGPGSFSKRTSDILPLICEPCPTGHSTKNRAGQQKCEPCPPGTFANATGAWACSACPPGHAQPIAGSSVCRLCPSGSLDGGGSGNSGEGAVDCQNSVFAVSEPPEPDDSMEEETARIEASTATDHGSLTDSASVFGSVPFGYWVGMAFVGMVFVGAGLCLLCYEY